MNGKSIVAPNSVLTFSLSGNPPPVVTWGLNKNETNRNAKSISRGGKEWYIHDYSLNYTKEICGKTLYFKAKVPGRKSLTWEEKHDIECKWLFHQFYSRWMFPDFRYLPEQHYILLANVSLLTLLTFESFLGNKTSTH